MSPETQKTKPMKLFTALLLSLTLVCGMTVAVPETANAATSKKTVILYFSNTGTTKSVANKIQKATKGKIVRIRASKAYTSRDLDYTDDNSRVSKEHASASTPAKSKVRPGIRNLAAIKRAVKSAKTVYIGYPIWWGEAPHIMYSLVEKVSLKGKVVQPFSTSISSGNGASSRHLKSRAIISKKTKWRAGKSFYGPSTQSYVTKWTKKVK